MTDTTTPDLLPCPFCGGDADLSCDNEGIDSSMAADDPFAETWLVLCSHCGATPESDWKNRSGAAEEWNTRPAPEATTARADGSKWDLAPELKALIDQPATPQPVTVAEAAKVLEQWLTTAPAGCGSQMDAFWSAFYGRESDHERLTASLRALSEPARDQELTSPYGDNNPPV